MTSVTVHHEEDSDQYLIKKGHQMILLSGKEFREVQEIATEPKRRKTEVYGEKSR